MFLEIAACVVCHRLAAVVLQRNDLLEAGDRQFVFRSWMDTFLFRKKLNNRCVSYRGHRCSNCSGIVEINSLLVLFDLI